MINFIIFGPPGSGKGTQAKNIQKKYNFKHLSTGEIFRDNIKNKTSLGEEAASYINKGELVPDEITSNMVKNYLQENKDAEGFLFDGYPRTIAQAEHLDDMLSEVLGATVTETISLVVPDEILIERLLQRGQTSGRSDDSSKEIIENRIKEYYTKTAPVADYYQSREKYTEVDGVGDVEVITERISSVIEEYK